jgi:hypothetical protein
MTLEALEGKMVFLEGSGVFVGFRVAGSFGTKEYGFLRSLENFQGFLVDFWSG